MKWPWQRTPKTTLTATQWLGIDQAAIESRLASNANDAPIPPMALADVGGRLSVDNAHSYFGSPHVVLPPLSVTDNWEMLRLDDDRINRIPPFRLIEMLADMSPEVSRALWDFLRLCNPGWTCSVLTAKGGEPDVRGQKMMDDFFDTLTDMYGSVDVVIGRLFMSAFVRGAVMAELVLDLNGRKMVDLVTPDPGSVRFIRSEDDTRGAIWQLAQWQNRPDPNKHEAVAGYVPLDWPTIRYVPIDPFPGNPYGRAIAAPALFSTLFLIGMMHDLRRVIAQQGYPRLDIEVSMERIKASMPPKILNDPDQYKLWVNNTIKQIQDEYKKLSPSSTYVHTDVLKINRPIGTVDASSLGAIDGLIQALERMAVRALKTMPFMMASTQTTTETLANREWEVQTAGIKSIQNLTATMLERLSMLGLQAQGHIAYVDWEFAELRQTERQRDAQARAIEISNAANTYGLGLVTLDEIANDLVGHDAVEDKPIYMPKSLVSVDGLDSPQPDGSQRLHPVLDVA